MENTLEQNMLNDEIEIKLEPLDLGPKLEPQQEKASETMKLSLLPVYCTVSVNEILLAKRKAQLSYEQKLNMKHAEIPRPELNINQNDQIRGKVYLRKFNKNMYNLATWLCGCNIKNAFFCYICVVMDYGASDKAWTVGGVTDVKHLGEKVKKHNMSEKHMINFIEFNMLGRVNIQIQLDSTYRQSINEHNKQVHRNRHVLNKLIDCIKFCGAFELALCGHDESATSDNPVVFHGLLNLLSEVDTELKIHIEKSKNSAFSGLSKTIQNELLDSIFAVCVDLIKNEIECADFVSIQADETTDSATLSQLVFIVRYEHKGAIYERFIGYINTSGHTADVISQIIMNELAKIELDRKPEKVIAQSYDAASVMSGQNYGVQAKIKETYKNANFIHSYAHQLNLVMQRCASQNKQVRIFFSTLEGFSAFFSRSPNRTRVLDDIVHKRLPRSSVIRWNFHARSIEMVYIYKDDILKCLTHIINADDSDSSTIRKAVGLQKTITDNDFLYWLEFFYKLMPYTEILINQLQQYQVDVIKIKKYVDDFKIAVQQIRDGVDRDFYVSVVDPDPDVAKRSRLIDKKNVVAKEVSDVIITNISDRFAFTDHLSVALLFETELFSKHRYLFPTEQFKIAVKICNLNAVALKHELTVIYSRDDFSKAAGALALLQLFSSNDLINIFPESVKLLRFICTIPMSTTESERCFSTLKRIKTFSRNTMKQDRLAALAMCSIEKSLIRQTDNFNELVIQHFASQEQPRMDFIYKKY